jgi:hypothetical protein
MARRTRSVRRRRSRRGGDVTLKKLKEESLASTGKVPDAYEDPFASSAEGISSDLDDIADNAELVVDPEDTATREAREAEALAEKIDQLIPGYKRKSDSERNALYAKWDKHATDDERSELEAILSRKPKFAFSPTPVRGGRRTRRRRRGGAMSDEEKRKIVDAILAAIATATPDKLQLLKAAVTPIEPPALKAEVAAIGAEDKSDADRVAEIEEALMKLDEAKLMELQSAILTKSGGYTPEEEAAIMKHRQARIAANRKRIEEAKRPLGQKIRDTSKDLFNGLMIVFGGLVSSTVGNARRRRTRRA